MTLFKFLSRRVILLAVLALVGVLSISPALLHQLEFVPAQVQASDDLGCNKEELGENDYKTCLFEKRRTLESKIAETKEEAQTLTSAISLVNNQMQLQRLQIAQTQAEITSLETEISELGERIEGLSLSLDRLTSMLIERVGSSYKRQRTSNLFTLFTTNSFNGFIAQYKYLQQAERQTARAMEEAENQRLVYDEQKNIKEIKQAALQTKRAELQAQQNELETSRASKERLLAQTKNDEATYQRLLAQAQREIDSLRAFVVSQFGSSYCLDSPAPQPDGWFFSQRDSRWCGASIGESNDTIGAVGCLVTSTAMIWKKHGQDVTPLSIAGNPNFFQLRTAYMILPTPPPPGYSSTTYSGQNLDVIDRELAEGRPVIVRISVSFTSVGTHFVVLKSGSGGEYIMNDPLYQADMAFRSKYSPAQITSVRTFSPS